MEKSTCPYCGGLLEAGEIRAGEDRAPYWMPEEASVQGFLLTAKAVEKSGGQVIGKASKVGFFQSESVCTGFCKTCRVMITFLD